jgi:hypothetical protein
MVIAWNGARMRAPRYPLHLPALYHSTGDSDWRQGQTVNISSSGALIQVDSPPPVGAAIEFRFVLPPAGRAAANGEIRGRARVVRLVEPDASSQWFCGIAIEQCELQPGQSNSLDAS